MPPRPVSRPEQAKVDVPDGPGRLPPALAALVIAALSAMLWFGFARLILAVF